MYSLDILAVSQYQLDLVVACFVRQEFVSREKVVGWTSSRKVVNFAVVGLSRAKFPPEGGHVID